jgi:hypothetical protein
MVLNVDNDPISDSADIPTDVHRVTSCNPYISLQWMLEGKTVGELAMLFAGELADAGAGAARFTRSVAADHGRRPDRLCRQVIRGT